MQKTFIRNAGFFGNLGQNMAKIVPKQHMFFQIKKPFGFDERPVKTLQKESKPILTWENLNLPKKLWDFYFDGITRRTRVEAIQKDLAYGGMYDFHVFTKTKGRLFESPPSYFRADKALYFPNIRGKTLTGKRMDLLDIIDKSKITILRVYSTDAGFEMTNDYFKVPNSEDSYLTDTGIKVFQQEFPNAQIVEIILSENVSKHLVHTFVTPAKVAKTRPEVQHERYLIAMRDSVLSRNDREKLLLTNGYSGYVYVLDPNYKIRWAGSGWPTANEVTTLWKSVKHLLKEKTIGSMK